MALAVQPGQGQHHLKHHFPSPDHTLLLTIPLLPPAQVPHSPQPTLCVLYSCTQAGPGLWVQEGGTHSIAPFYFVSPSHRPSSTRILLCQVVPSSQAICTAAASPEFSTVQGDSCSPACSWDLCSALETEKKALKRQASSCSQHHALVSASYCTNGQHTHIIYSPFFT